MDNSALLGLAVVGVVEFVKRLFAQDWQAAAIIVGATIVGGIVGHSLGMTYLIGSVYGLEGSGLITTATYFSK